MVNEKDVFTLFALPLVMFVRFIYYHNAQMSPKAQKPVKWTITGLKVTDGDVNSSTEVSDGPSHHPQHAHFPEGEATLSMRMKPSSQVSAVLKGS